MSRLKIALVCLMQENFDGGKMKQFQNAVKILKKYEEEWLFDLYYYPELILTSEDSRKARVAIDEIRPDFLMIQMTTFPSGEVVAHLAKSCHRIGLWALPETSYSGSNFVSSNNSLCGANMAGSIIAHNLKQFDIKYKWFYGQNGNRLFDERFLLTVRVLDALKRLSQSRVALVGGVSPGFYDLGFDERPAIMNFGLDIQRGHEFSEIHKRACSYNTNELDAMAGEFTCQKCAKDVTKQDLLAAARYYRAFSDFSADNKYDALAISCWPQIKTETLACSIIGKLNQNSIPASCEGDIPGAVSMLIMYYLTGKPSTLMDLCAFDENDETLLMWHCGPSPEFYADGNGMEMTCSYQLNHAGETIRYGLINKLKFRPQPVTFMRLTGEWDKLFLLNGVAIDYDKCVPDGSGGWIGSLRLNREPAGVLDSFNTIMTQGFQHHYPMMAGDLTEELMEMKAWLGLSSVPVVPYENYLQAKSI